MEPDNQLAGRAFSLGEFIDSPAGSELLAAADFAFGRVDFGTAAGFLKDRLAAMRDLEEADDLALGDMLEQIMALQDTVASLNGFAVAFNRQSGALRRCVAEIKTFARNPTADNRARVIEAAIPFDGLRVRMPPRVRKLLRPFIKGYYWRRGLLSYGKLYEAMCDHMKEGVVIE
jgi:hypothetical protein